MPLPSWLAGELLHQNQKAGGLEEPCGLCVRDLEIRQPLSQRPAAGLHCLRVATLGVGWLE